MYPMLLLHVPVNCMYAKAHAIMKFLKSYVWIDLKIIDNIFQNLYKSITNFATIW